MTITVAVTEFAVRVGQSEVRVSAYGEDAWRVARGQDCGFTLEGDQERATRAAEQLAVALEDLRQARARNAAEEAVLWSEAEAVSARWGSPRA